MTENGSIEAMVLTTDAASCGAAVGATAGVTCVVRCRQHNPRRAACGPPGASAVVPAMNGRACSTHAGQVRADMRMPRRHTLSLAGTTHTIQTHASSVSQDTARRSAEGEADTGRTPTGRQLNGDDSECVSADGAMSMPTFDAPGPLEGAPLRASWLGNFSHFQWEALAPARRW